MEMFGLRFNIRIEGIWRFPVDLLVGDAVREERRAEERGNWELKILDLILTRD